jgi:hypothetical protein
LQRLRAVDRVANPDDGFYLVGGYVLLKIKNPATPAGA